MRSTGLSTHVTKSPLRLIFSYGLEALGNRRKDLFLIAFIFLLLPDLILSVTWSHVASVGVDFAKAHSNDPAIKIIESVISLVLSHIFPVGAAAILMTCVGILAIARTSVDYFESRPSSVLDVSLRALRTLATKGLGVFVFLVMITPIIAVVPLAGTIGISMLLMLPVTLTVTHKGGFRTAWDTLFLRYAEPTPYGRWPIFLNVLFVAGTFLSLLLTFSLLVNFALVMDVWFEIPAGSLASDLNLLGLKMSLGHFISLLLKAIFDAFWLSVAIPFTAATLHLSTAPKNHVGFEAEV